jgi:hypothetical protein
MKRITVYLSLTLCTCSIFSQTKYDNIWILGYDPNIPDQKFGGTLFDFSDFPPVLEYFEMPIGNEIQSSICNREGKLLFYTNGCSIVNNNHKIMMKGDSLNYGDIYEVKCGASLDYPTWQGEITLPLPENDSLYYLFHLMQIDDLYNHNARFLKTIVK